jgi:hypothetical protein
MRGTTAAEAAARFQTAYAARQARRRAGRPWQPPQTPTAEGLVAFREIVLSKVGRLTPRWRTTIHQAVEAEWGVVDRRRVDRAIAWLIALGAVRRTLDGYLRVRAQELA